MIAHISAFLANESLALTLGELLMVAILLGAVLDRGGKDLISWGVAVGVFALFILVGAPQAMSNPAVVIPVAAFMVLNTVVYLTGLGLGWLASVIFRTLYWRRVRKTMIPRQPDCS